MSKSSSSSSVSAGGGVGFAGLLTIVFIVLKMTGFISWSWWWVISPLWISAALTLVIAAIAIFILLVIAVLKA